MEVGKSTQIIMFEIDVVSGAVLPSKLCVLVSISYNTSTRDVAGGGIINQQHPECQKTSEDMNKSRVFMSSVRCFCP